MAPSAVWTTPKDWAHEEQVGESDMDEQLSSNLLYLKARLDVVGYAKAYLILDLSGAAQTDVPLAHFSGGATLVKAIFLYTEASSADAGITLKIGKETDDDYYFTGTSEINKALWYEKEVALLQTAVAAGDTVVCSSAGGKTGTGEILVCIEYLVDV